MTNKICNNLLKHILILSVLFCIFTISFISPRVTYAQNLIFEDNFNDNAVNQESWNIKNFILEKYGSFGSLTQLDLIEELGFIRIYGTDILSDQNIDGNMVGWFGKSLFSSSSFENGDLILTTKINIAEANSGYQAHLLIEFDKYNRITLSIGNYVGNNAIQMVFDEKGNYRCIESNQQNIVIGGCSITPFNLQKGTPYNLKISIDNETGIVKGFVNENLIFESIYKGYFSDFHVGIAASVRSTGNYIDARFDDFKLYAEPTEKTLNVPDLKQFTAQWANLEYDSAKKWYPTNPTISRWGCALTSASMILKYYGHDINPDALNEWLNAQKDGYTRNGSIIWPAISRLTQLRYSKEYNWPILEFSYVNYSYESLKDNIKDDKPGILKLLKPIYDKNGKLTSYSSHFIVGKGYDNTDILINDPGINGHESLSNASSYWGYPSSVVNFKKTETDLSYIVLFIDDEFDIKLTNNQGEVLEGECFFKEAPMTDPENPNAESSGIETLNAFYYPKPETGTYNIEISGSGIYRLDYYIYDDEGKVTLGNSFGLIDNTSIDVFEFDFDKNNVDYSELPKISFETVVSFWDRIYNNGYIESHGLYTSVRHLLKNAENNINNNGNSSKRLLFNIIKKLEKTDRHIDKVLFNHFIYQIETLISDL